MIYILLYVDIAVLASPLVVVMSAIIIYSLPPQNIAMFKFVLSQIFIFGQ
jgi:hypothetical protein